MSSNFPQGYFYIKSRQNGFVLDVFDGGMSNDTQIIVYPQKYNDASNQLWSYDDGFLNQKWGYHDGFIHVLADPRLVLDIRGGISKEGSQIILYERKHQNNANQQWVVEPFGNAGGQYAHLSHEIIAGAAAFEAVRAYARHQQNEGKPIAHPHAKEAIAAIASAELLEQHNWGGDKEQAKKAAEQAAQNYYTREYEGFPSVQ
ncbi:hypothetical protein K450DRAFT_260741 [Umbelopsis ramanniana AG]|uniref:Ricin B lectin domain-containing protein n=1 Tax=Umbelopsis ramanniana AG TaxID=1314678 RepID=A0AAD5E1D9_UMBRA|nr:uncharacterized protein K450DRAFT_260741 [Umbelopsis ramanniana AG]KAI8575691.1 hypothetical protein K450DRAFT_260741 [Umbelopsis ramanniana AG]